MRLLHISVLLPSRSSQVGLAHCLPVVPFACPLISTGLLYLHHSHKCVPLTGYLIVRRSWYLRSYSGGCSFDAYPSLMFCELAVVLRCSCWEVVNHAGNKPGHETSVVQVSCETETPSHLYASYTGDVQFCSLILPPCHKPRTTSQLIVSWTLSNCRPK